MKLNRTFARSDLHGLHKDEALHQLAVLTHTDAQTDTQITKHV